MKEVVQLLGFLGALRSYGFIDRVGNAVDEATVLEALRDAVRAYLTLCLERRERRCVEVEKGVEIKCPDLNPEELEKSIGVVGSVIRRSKVDLIKVSREIALRAYASIPKMIENRCTP